ncbi:ComEC/Rec2 family competence protein [Mesobacterium pallidum]|uniref:ComEC/Rec2 family competence protein n=1 Tax=Mesobacterium pallidum TaxID=2872037 RepID=UPI001EE28F37|nr:ComEC/Rec2 family competence protein [Mesobacterium pallidum]
MGPPMGPAGLRARIAAGVLEKRGQLFPFVPVLMGLGVAAFFSLRVEPPVWLLGCLGFVALVGGFWAAWRAGPVLAVALWVPVLLVGGFALAGARTHVKAAPVLTFRYFGPIEGRIVAVDRSASDAVRLMLDAVVLEDLAPDRTPTHVRVSLHGPEPRVPLIPGQLIGLTGHLSPPGGPVEPGGFDFRRHAWFLSLGGVGYTRDPVVALAPAPEGAWLGRARMALATRITTALPGQRGAMAAALLTGDRSTVSQDVLTDLRESNLAHLLAISGLHMGLLAGFVFAATRLALTVSPPGWRRRKIAALVALAAGAGYLALSGGNVATQRAYVMVAVALGAILADRRAISLRAVAIAATLILAFRPEALLGPGFQMSFAATTALVAVFSVLRDRPQDAWRLPKWTRPVMAVVISSGVAGLATAPFAAAHFNIMVKYGLIANLASVPLMGTIVIPAGVVALLAMPVGLEAAPLWVMGQGTGWILSVAHWAAGVEGAVMAIPAPGPWVLPLLSLGALWLVLWPGRSRLAGLAPAALALALWPLAERPEVLVAEGGTLVGVMTEDGRALSRAKGAGFVASVWLENDGDRAWQQDAAARAAAPAGLVWSYPTGTGRIVHLSGKRAVAAFPGCGPGDVIVASVAAEFAGCEVYDPDRLRETGSLAIRDGRVITARDRTGRRLWSPG